MTSEVSGLSLYVRSNFLALRCVVEERVLAKRLLTSFEQLHLIIQGLEVHTAVGSPRSLVGYIELPSLTPSIVAPRSQR